MFVMILNCQVHKKLGRSLRKKILPQFFYELWQFKIFRKYVTLGTNGLRLADLQITSILERQKKANENMQ